MHRVVEQAVSDDDVVAALAQVDRHTLHGSVGGLEVNAGHAASVGAAPGTSRVSTLSAIGRQR